MTSKHAAKRGFVIALCCQNVAFRFTATSDESYFSNRLYCP